VRLQISRTHTDFACSDQQRVALREEFNRSHCLVLRQLLDPWLLGEVHRELADAEVEEVTHDVGHEMGFKADRSAALLEFAVNDDVLFEIIDALTGCGPIGCFRGRVYQMRAGGKHQFDWHDDLSYDRLIAMSVNLGLEPYQGGVLQIADAESKTALHSVANVGVGDAVVFRLARTLVHRVTPVEGPNPKIAFAGWFCSQPSYHELLTGSRGYPS
jgi:hypothetical protein